LLSDPGSKIIREFDILNDMAPKGAFYGIPYPGTYILDPKGVVVAKYFEDDYTQRFTASDILANEFHAPVSSAHSTVTAKHLTISASAGVGTVHVGERVVLAVDIDLPKNVHVYAPGVHHYIPIDLQIPESPEFAVQNAVYPASKMLRLKAIDETVPVYTGHVRVLREVTFGKTVKPGELTVDGKFRYQACDDRECFIPETVPLKWTFQVEALDRQRAPTALQHK
jgi:hypothetical protein